MHKHSLTGLVVVLASGVTVTALAAPSAAPAPAPTTKAAPAPTPTPTPTATPISKVAPPSGGIDIKALNPRIVAAARAVSVLPSPPAGCTTAPSDAITFMGQDGMKVLSAPYKAALHPQCPNTVISDFVVDASANTVTTPTGSPAASWTNRLRFTAVDSREMAVGNFVQLKGVTREVCQSFQQAIRLYVKGPTDAAFRLLGGGQMSASWLDGENYCFLNQPEFFGLNPQVPAPNPPGVKTTYRVVLETPSPAGGLGNITATAKHVLDVSHAGD